MFIETNQTMQTNEMTPFCCVGTGGWVGGGQLVGGVNINNSSLNYLQSD